MNQLMPHQKTGGAFLAERAFVLLADDMGLGKSVVAIHGADLCGAQKILVICPAVVRPHWAREFAKWQQTPRPITIQVELPKTPPGPGVTVVSQEALARVPEILARGAPYDLIIVDEVHSMRDYSSKRTKHFAAPSAVRYIDNKGKSATIPPGCWTWTTRLWGLTGTPIVNSAADVWPFFYGPMKSKISWWDFCKTFAERMQPTASGEKPIGLKNAEDLATLLRPYMLRRTLDSVGIKLPPLQVGTVGFNIAPDTMATIMAGLEQWSPARLATALENNDDLKDANLMRVRRVLGLAKVPGVAHYVWDLIVNRASGPVVVFFHHTDVKTQLQTIFTEQCKFRVGVIDGKITPAQLPITEAAFQAGSLDILLVQTQAGGQGITLHRSHTCVTAELPWTAMALWQSVKRIHRIGQTQACTATILKVNGCWIEDVMAGIVTKKHRASENLLSLLTTTQ